VTDYNDIQVQLGGEYTDIYAVDSSYICAVAGNIKTVHILTINGPERPQFQIFDDEGDEVGYPHPSLYVAVLVAKDHLLGAEERFLAV
jgi:hypothetical protein